MVRIPTLTEQHFEVCGVEYFRGVGQPLAHARKIGIRRRMVFVKQVGINFRSQRKCIESMQARPIS